MVMTGRTSSEQLGFFP